MSRGPGTFQRRVIDALASYHRLGADPGWRWSPPRSRYALGSYADANYVHSYERGQIVALWMLRRDLGCDRASLSRALQGLDRLGLVWRRTGDLSLLVDGYGDFGNSRNAKYASLTPRGLEVSKRQQANSSVVGAYGGSS